ncbi:MAG TPA: hypothetical protein DCL35_04380 [Candidatus Omnitrophica bacterium]|nr:hypothetical protein [Candidatus Omnitrophota bacterium]
MMRLKNAILLPVIFACLVSLSGCFFLVASSIGAVGGYAITRDTIQGEYDAKYDAAWKAALNACNMLGAVSNRDSTKGIVEALVDKAKIKIEIAQLTPVAIRVKVKARKGLFPRLGTAEKVFVKIVQQLIK